MRRTKHSRERSDGTLEHGTRLAGLSGREEALAEVVRRTEHAWMLRTKQRQLRRIESACDRLRVGVPPALREDKGEFLLGLEDAHSGRVGQGLLAGDRPPEEFLGRLEVAARPRQRREVVTGVGRDQIVASERAVERGPSLVEPSELHERVSLRVVDRSDRSVAGACARREPERPLSAELLERTLEVPGRRLRQPDRGPDLGLDDRIGARVRELRLGLREDEREQLRIESLRNRRIKRGQHGAVEPGDLAPACRLSRAFDQSVGESTDRRRKGGDQRRDADDRGTVPARHLAQPVHRRCRPSTHVAAREPAIEVVGKFVRRRIPSRRIPLERAQHDPVQFVLKRAAESRRCVPRQHGARAADPSLGDLSLEVERASHSLSLRRERTGADERLVQHHSDRPHIHAPVDLGLPGGDLGRHVGRRRRGRPLLGLRPQAIESDELRDAEVDHARLVVRPVALGDSDGRSADKDVARLQISVEDPLPMGVADRPAQEDEHPHARLERVPVAMTPGVERNPLNELHHEVRRPILRRSRIEDARDVRVLEPCKRDLLRLEPPSCGRTQRAHAEDLHSHRPNHGLELLAPPDDAVRALADHPVQAHTADARHRGRLALDHVSEEKVRREMLLAGFHVGATVPAAPPPPTLRTPRAAK